MLLEDGMENVEMRYRLISQGMRRAIESVGLKIFPENPSLSLTTVIPPENIDPEVLRKEMLKLGIRTAGGQGKLRGKIFRISHMGMNIMDMPVVLSALELALRSLGYNFEFGKMVGRYLNAVHSGVKDG